MKKYKKYLPKGTMGAGTSYVILAIMIIAAGGTLLIGNIIPSASPKGNQPVMIINPNLEPAKNNLQLETFKGVTYTPTPTPIPTPIPDQPPAPPIGNGGGSVNPGSGNVPPPCCVN